MGCSPVVATVGGEVVGSRSVVGFSSPTYPTPPAPGELNMTKTKKSPPGQSAMTDQQKRVELRQREMDLRLDLAVARGRLREMDVALVDPRKPNEYARDFTGKELAEVSKREAKIAAIEHELAQNKAQLSGAGPASIEQRAESPSDLPILSETAAKTRELLLEQPDDRGLTAPKIVDALAKRDVYTDDSTLRTRYLPELKPYGLEHKKRIGYRIRPSARPST